MGEAFDYAEGFKSLDLDAVIGDLQALMTDSHGLVAGRLRPLRAAAHPDGVAQRGHVSHGDGRGGAGSGTQRFAPLIRLRRGSPKRFARRRHAPPATPRHGSGWP
jgi:catalase-peroxidase